MNIKFVSKLFYDHLILLDDIYTEIEVLAIETGHKKKLKKTIDDLVNHRVLTRILDLLPDKHHEEFLELFHATPYDTKHLHYLQNKTEKDIIQELVKLGKEIKEEIRKEIKRK